LAQLLVSVRSADEARTALAGGASIIDVKEPNNGPLGMAPWLVWRDVQEVVATSAPISVALGELEDWRAPDREIPPPRAWSGISYRKVALAGTDTDWQDNWRAVRNRLGDESRPPWIAVIYADWQAARAPEPESILEVAMRTDCVTGVLVDTWDKSRPIDLGESLVLMSERVRRAGKLMAMAGGLNRRSIATLERIAPNIVAVRGAACEGGDRRLAIDLRRVADLARISREVHGYQEPSSNFTP
jgi:uncharacterized protein (UPF0264 family)